MSTPTDRRYLDSHEWHRPEDDGTVTLGISQFAVNELNDVTYLEFLKDSGSLSKGETFGEIESVKATSELYAGIDGEIVEVNQAALDEPDVINRDCYGEGWMIRVKPSDPTQLDALLDAAAYDALHADG